MNPASWYRAQSKKIAHRIKGEWESTNAKSQWYQMQCGTFIYKDRVIEDNDAPRCKKCMRRYL